MKKNMFLLLISILILVIMVGCKSNSKSDKAIEDGKDDIIKTEIDDKEESSDDEQLDNNDNKEAEENTNTVEEPKIEEIITGPVLNLTGADHRKINIFFSNFSEAYFPSFDVENYELEELIGFAYIHNKINNYESIKIEESDYYIDKSQVEKTINKYFGLKINHESAGEFQYRNGRYYTPAADGESYNKFSQVDTLIDNEDGTYSAYISIYMDNNYDEFNDVYYDTKSTWEDKEDSYEYLRSAEAKIKKAVVDGKNTYQLLKYKED